MVRNVIVFGSGGMLGTYLMTYFSGLNDFHIRGIGRKSYDPLHSAVDSLWDIFKKMGINQDYIIINALGFIPQAESNSEKSEDEKYIKVNSIYPQMLACICQHYRCRLIHISTDCVFSGISDSLTHDVLMNGYHENSPCDETSIYGFSKRLGEPVSGYCSTIRCSLIGEEINNKRSLLEWVKQQQDKTIGGYSNQYWNGITCLQLAESLEIIIRNESWWEGVRHLFSYEPITKYQLISLMAEIYCIVVTIVGKPLPRQIDKQLTSLFPLNSSLNIPDIRTQIKKLKDFDLYKKFIENDVESLLF
ncbi:MAG TPA: sugar nucleotide-binding protein [Saprospiraceae bacterium]|nr:sugar nucleotide-binding protein [Saprospiraceae bacterium]